MISRLVVNFLKLHFAKKWRALDQKFSRFFLTGISGQYTTLIFSSSSSSLKSTVCENKNSFPCRNMKPMNEVFLMLFLDRFSCEYLQKMNERQPTFQTRRLALKE